MPMLTVSGLTKRFGALRAVNDVSFDVEQGEILGLIGPNGSGKSTTFNCIAGLYAPNGGTITFEGAEIAGLAPNRICHKGIGRTFQIPRPFHNLSLLENVATAAFFGQDRGKTQQRVLAARRGGARAGRAAGRRARHHRRAWRGRAEETRTCPRARDAAAAAAGGRKPQRARSFRDGAGRRHAPAHPAREGHHHRVGRAHHGRADARGRSGGRARPRRGDFRRAAEGGAGNARVVEVYLGERKPYA